MHTRASKFGVSSMVCVAGLVTGGSASAFNFDTKGPFISNTNRTVVQYYDFSSDKCPAGAPCPYDLDVALGSNPASNGIDTAEVFIAGVKWEVGQPDEIKEVGVTAINNGYDPVSGKLSFRISATFATLTNQDFIYSATVGVIFANSGAAKFTPVAGGCTGVGSCEFGKSVPAAIPTGMQFIGLAAKNWDISSVSGSQKLNALSIHPVKLDPGPPDVGVGYECSMHDSTARNSMQCTWDATVIAFDPAEMEPFGAPPSPYAPSGRTTDRVSWTQASQNPSGTKITGLLNALDGLTLSYEAGIENNVWVIEAMARYFSISPSALDTGLTDYDIFLGTDPGNLMSGFKYNYEESRTLGFLR